MARKKISQLPSASSIDGSEYIPVVQDAETRKVLASEFQGEQGDQGDQGDAGSDGTPVWTGAWSGATTYAVGEAVSRSGSSYVANTGHTNHQPPNASYWDVLAQAGTNGSSFSWTADFDDDLSAFTTPGSSGQGTWQSSGGVYQWNDGGSNGTQGDTILYEDFPASMCVFQADFRIQEGGPSVTYVGFGLGQVGSGYTVRIAILEDGNVSFSGSSTSAGMSVGTWYTLKVVKVGGAYDIYLDGAFLTSGEDTTTLFTSVGLIAGNTGPGIDPVQVRNATVWTPDLGVLAL